MRLKVFTLSFSDAAGGFDDGKIQEYLVDKEVVDVANHFFTHERTPYLVLIVSYRDVAREERRASSQTNRWREERESFDEAQRAAFDALRAWRAARARQDGVPPYIVLTNRQLASIVRLRPESRSALMSIAGIGEVKAEQYGQEVLDVLARAFLTGNAAGD